jgi:glycerol kinase
MKYILAIDQSTSGTKGMLFNFKGRVAASLSLAHKQLYPRPGWVEHDPEEIYSNTIGILNSLLTCNSLKPRDIVAIGISNQRETVVLWDAETGKPVCNAIVWQCSRASELCAALERDGVDDLVKERTGLVLSPYFSAAKAAWALRNVDGAAALAESGRLRMGTVDSWLLYKLTSGTVHATDLSNASRTQLFNLKTLDWDDDLLMLFGIKRSMLPEIRMSDGGFGAVAVISACEGITIAADMGDSHAALFGQNCFELGMAKVTYGTGSSVMMNTGNNVLLSTDGLVASVAWGMDGKASYVLEGNINSAGATLNWLCSLGLLSSPKEAARLAAMAAPGGVYLVPAFSGLGAPYWDSIARAALFGMTFETSREQLARAAEESIAYQVKDIFDKMLLACGVMPPEIRTDGGPTRDAFLMQFQADMLGLPVTCSALSELSAYGVCLMAGKASGVWGGLEDLRALRNIGMSYSPAMPEKDRLQLYHGWQAAVK